MKAGTVLLTLFFSACALVGVVWLGHIQPISVQENERLRQQGLKPAPEIEVSGPQPKAVADETNFNFGQSIVGNEESHAFILKNEGETTLVLEKGLSTCQCTISSLEKNKVEPGESVTITLKWLPEKPDEMFIHSAEIKTNDPRSRTIKFEIEGEVVEMLVAVPAEMWSMPDIFENKQTHFSGHIVSSAIEDFQIEKITTSNPLLTTQYFKLNESELEQHSMKSGYRVELELKQGAPVGSFNESLTIVTNLKDIDAFIVNVRSHRFGPMTIRPFQNSRWNPKTGGVDMGNFSASDGKVSTLHLYTNDFGNKDLEISIIENKLKYLKFTVALDDSFSGNKSKRYLLTFEIPPGSPKAVRRGQNAAEVRVKTNHPEVPELTFRVHFISR